MKRIALLRAVNVGGRKVVMAELRAMMAACGFERAQTLLQTGNLVFDAPAEADAAVEARLEHEIQARLGVATEVMVRTAAEWDALIEANPMPEAAARDPAHLVVLALKAAVDAQALVRLRAAVKGRETLAAVGRQLYAWYPDGIGESKLTVGLMERQLGVRMTGRNWNTVLKLAALARQ